MRQSFVCLFYFLRRISLLLETTKKRYEKEKSLSKNLEDKDRIAHDFTKKREQVDH
jgi:hypothetical protein